MIKILAIALLGYTVESSPAGLPRGSVDFSVTVIDGAKIAMHEIAPGVMLVEESCHGCEDPGPRLSWWRVNAAEFVYTYGGSALGGERIRYYADSK